MLSKPEEFFGNKSFHGVLGAEMGILELIW
jgi:hypothetical protein